MGKASGGDRQNFGGVVSDHVIAAKYRSGLRTLFRKAQADRELDEDLRGFLEMAAEGKMNQGMSRKEAIRAVRLERGNLEVTQDVVRSAGWESLVPPY